VRRESVRSSAALRRARLLRHTEATLLFDVGAYVGQYVRDVRSGGFKGRVVSCEPQSQTFHQLRAASSSDPLWEVRNVALGAQSGYVELNLSESAYSSSVLSMTDRLREISPNQRYVGVETVEVTTLDELLAEYASPTDRIALKIDVQGYESKVLDGGDSALKRVCFIECEINLDPLYAGQSDASHLLSRLFGSGLRLASTELAYVDPETGAAAWLDAIFIREN
jgi:FkbM family methyltransferase